MIINSSRSVEVYYYSINIGMSEKITLSIVTVTFNAEKLIKNTLDSVIHQTFINFEYIFIDSCSTDKTNMIIDEYAKKFANRGIQIKHVIEEDNGIYDGMNKGTKFANGEWIYFLNAGDSLTSDYTLEYVFSTIKDTDDVIYGGTNYITETGILIKTGMGDSPNAMPKHMPFCVQASFTRASLQRKFLYDVNYPISADYDFFLKLYENNFNFRKIEIVVNNYLMGGYSSSKPFETYKEVMKIREKHGFVNNKNPIQILKRVRFYFICKFNSVK